MKKLKDKCICSRRFYDLPKIGHWNFCSLRSKKILTEVEFDKEWKFIFNDIVELFRFHGIPFDKHSTADKIYKRIKVLFN